MLRFLVRRLIGAIAVLFAISVLVFLIFNVVPATQSGAADRGQERDPAADQEHRRGMGLRQVAAGAVLDADEADLHRRTSTSYNRPHQHRRSGSSKASRRPSPSASARRSSGCSSGSSSATYRRCRAGGFIDRGLTVLALIGISMPVFWLASILLYYLTYKIDTVPAERLRTAVRNPASGPIHLILPWITPGGPLRRLLQPRAALQHARRDERGLRPHGARQGTERAPGDDASRAAQLADPDHHPLRARLRRD